MLCSVLRYYVKQCRTRMYYVNGHNTDLCVYNMTLPLEA